MSNENEFLEKLDDNLFSNLPISYKAIQAQRIARNETDEDTDQEVRCVEVNFYDTMSFIPFPFYKPISKIIKPTIENGK